MTPEEIELLSELTIIIPTYNRPLELERSIEYWRDTPVTVHILDGSPKPSFPAGQVVLVAPKIHYHSIPAELNQKPMENYARRLVKGMTLIDTNFGALLADDDFFTIEGLCDALRILKFDEKLDAVIGKCATYHTSSRKVVLRKKYLNWVQDESLRSEQLSIRVTNDPGKNFVYYGVLRSEKLKEIHSRANSFVFSDFRVNELIAHHLGLAYCRTRLMDEYLWIRQRALTKNQNYSYFIRPAEDSESRLLSDIFFEAFGEIDPNIDEDLKLQWSLQKVQLIEKRLRADDKKYAAPTELGRIAIFVSVVKRFLMNSFLAMSLKSQLVFLRFLPSSFRAAIDAEMTPEFKSRFKLERVLLMPREELRLKANI